LGTSLIGSLSSKVAAALHDFEAWLEGPIEHFAWKEMKCRMEITLSLSSILFDAATEFESIIARALNSRVSESSCTDPAVRFRLEIH
jgi:hypothetical protein